MNEELLLATEEVRLRPEATTWFIPIGFDDCEIPDRRIGPEFSTRSFHRLDMFPDWERSVERLIETIQSKPDHLLGTFDVFRDIDAPWCPELVVIPPGKFMMGSPADEDGTPQREVTFAQRFAVGRYPVTFEEYDPFVEAIGGERPRDHMHGYKRIWAAARRPVINISWYEAKSYLMWLGNETRQPYRLLWEAEWEYACRAGSTTRYWWGDDPPTPKQANFGENVGTTIEVGSYPPNPWGLFDMYGNVLEWCEDSWNKSSWGVGDDDRSRRVVRGGAWFHGPDEFHSANRGEVIALNRFDSVGFRVARTLH